MTRDEQVIGFVCSDGALGIGPERDMSHLLVAGTGAGIARRLRSLGHGAVCVEEHASGDAAFMNGALGGGQVLQHPVVRQELERAGCRHVVPFKPSRRTERVCAEIGVELVAPQAQLVRQLENKLELPAIAAESGVPIPRSERVLVDETLAARAGSFDEGDPVIFQPAVGYAGEHTTLIETAADIDVLLACARGAAGKLVAVAAGSPLTVTGVVLDTDTVIAGAVCHQLTGIAECTTRSFASCGNDWSLPLDPGIEPAVRTLARRVGLAMAARGFRGAFGIDAVASGVGDIVLIEVNPRFTASFALQLQMQQMEDGPTLYDAHLVAFDLMPRHVRRDAIVERYSIAQSDPLGLAAAERAASSMVIQNTSGEAVTPAQELQPGIYRIGDDGFLERTGAGIRVDEIEPGSDAFVLLSRSTARPVPPGAEIARVLTRRRVLADDTGRTLEPWAACIVQEVVAAIRGDDRRITDVAGGRLRASVPPDTSSVRSHL